MPSFFNLRSLILIISTAFIFNSCKQDNNFEIIDNNHDIEHSSKSRDLLNTQVDDSIQVTFDNPSSHKYLSPVIYLVNGNNPRVAWKNKTITTGGIDGSESLTSPFQRIFLHLANL